MSHEIIRNWSYKFGKKFLDVIKKKGKKVMYKWHLNDITMKVNGEYYILWRAVDAEGYGLDVFL